MTPTEARDRRVWSAEALVEDLLAHPASWPLKVTMAVASNVDQMVNDMADESATRAWAEALGRVDGRG